MVLTKTVALRERERERERDIKLCLKQIASGKLLYNTGQLGAP